MGRQKRKADERPVFDAIRKPTAPPGHKFGDDKPADRARPSLRKTKHKKRIDTRGDNADI